jgi:tryptophan synthase
MIEIGLPFTDPAADGPTIQKANKVALAQGVNLAMTLKMIKASREKGLHVPLVLMGYYNPVLSYGEENFVRDCHDAGVNGFIVADLPPEEGGNFQRYCRSYG